MDAAPSPAPEDRRWFALDDPARAEFDDHLARPPVVKPRLARLLAEDDPRGQADAR